MTRRWSSSSACPAPRRFNVVEEIANTQRVAVFLLERLRR